MTAVPSLALAAGVVGVNSPAISLVISARIATLLADPVHRRLVFSGLSVLGLRIAVPALIASCEDDRFGTADTARTLHQRIPGARLTVYPDGGHIWLGHDEGLAAEIASFVAATRSEG